MGSGSCNLSRATNEEKQPTVERGQAKDRLSGLSKVPGPDPGVDAHTDDCITFCGMPIDVCNGPIMGAQNMFDRCLAGH